MKYLMIFFILAVFLVVIPPTISAQGNCLTNADKDCNGALNLTELTNHINAWYACSACIPDIFQSLQGYFGIPFCGDWNCNATIGEDCNSCQNDCGQCPAQNKPLPSGYIAYWKFDGDANDQTGAYNGNIVGSPQFMTNGVQGQALDLNGASDFVEVANPSWSFNTLTISAWIKPVVSPSLYDYIIMSGSVFSMSLHVRWDLNRIQFLYGDGTNTDYARNYVTPPTDTWSHLLITYDAGSSKLYLNGLLNSTDVRMNYNATTLGNIEIGRYWEGQLDEVMIYDRAINATEVQMIYDAQTSGLPLCSDDMGCSSAGSFCSGSIPYNCTLNSSDGCLDRTDGQACSANENCIAGICLIDPCFGINSCVDYNQTGCPGDSCGRTATTGCFWNISSGNCEDIPNPCTAISTCADYNQTGCPGDSCGKSTTAGCQWNSSSSVCEDIPDPCAGITQCNQYQTDPECTNNNCRITWPGCTWNSSTNNCEATVVTGSSWTPPIGIPNPPFGIKETVDMYIGQQYTFTDGRGTIDYPQNSVTGMPYTHYIDNTGNCDNNNNPYGTESNPRCTIPPDTPNLDPHHHYIVDLLPGDVYEIHGTHNFDIIRPGGWLGGYEFAGGGTKQNPAFVRGGDPNNRAVFTKNSPNAYATELAGSFIILENIEFNKNLVDIAFATNSSMRNCEVHNNSIPAGRAVTMSSVRDFVFYNNHVHHNWGTYPDNSHDMHSTAVSGDSHRVWVVDNYLHHASYMPNGTAAKTGGDSIQVMGPRNEPWRLTHVYIGRNHMHTDTENAVDIKASTNVVVSQNIAHDYKNEGIMINHEMANYTWFIFNEIYDGRVGVRPEDAIGKTFVINNVIHDIDYPVAGQTNIYGVYVGGIWARIVPSVFIGNTLYNVTGGILTPVGNQHYVNLNNIISYLPKPWYHFGSDWASQCSSSEIDYNLVYQPTGVSGYSPDGVARIKCSGTYNGLSAFQSAFPNNCINCIEADPMFTNAQTGDFSLSAGSNAIDRGTSSGTVQQVYDEYFNIFGVDIRVDFTGKPRTGTWDIGAYEFV
jgi:hypothetical protein